MDSYIKNIPIDEVFKLKDEIKADRGQIVSKTLFQNGHVSITLFAFSKGEEISAHDSEGDAFVHVLEGTGEFHVGDDKFVLNAGDALVMPHKVMHSVYAPSDFKWILTVVFPN